MCPYMWDLPTLLKPTDEKIVEFLVEVLVDMNNFLQNVEEFMEDMKFMVSAAKTYHRSLQG